VDVRGRRMIPLALRHGHVVSEHLDPFAGR
jgi:hypothetical protein